MDLTNDCCMVALSVLDYALRLPEFRGRKHQFWGHESSDLSVDGRKRQMVVCIKFVKHGSASDYLDSKSKEPELDIYLININLLFSPMKADVRKLN